jgi:hypothetical protein
MSTTDYVVDILLIVVIFRQIRVQPYTARNAIVPLAIVVWAGTHYLRGFHVAGNDIALIAILTLCGLALGFASAMTTKMWRDDGGRVLGRVGFYACLAWIVGMGFRFLFAVYASSHGGGIKVAEFSRDHAIIGSEVWTTALVFMAFAEVLSRVAILQVRRMRLAQSAASPASPTHAMSTPHLPAQASPPSDAPLARKEVSAE